jgi:RNA polymerase sigma factor (sigma-70 family)
MTNDDYSTPKLEPTCCRFGFPPAPHYFNMTDNNLYYPPGTDLKFKMLTAQEETDYFRRAKEGDGPAREFIIVNHLLFAATYARRFTKGKLPDNEVVSAANLGVMKAYEAFDYKRLTRFAAYVKHYIRAELAALWRSKNIVDYNGNFPAPIDGEELTLLDVDEGIVQPDVESLDTRRFVMETLEAAKGVLTARESLILHRHYEEGLNFREIGDALGVSRAAIQAAHAKALEKLRKELKHRGLDSQGEV